MKGNFYHKKGEMNFIKNNTPKNKDTKISTSFSPFLSLRVFQELQEVFL